jgi:hypothetical protein
MRIKTSEKTWLFHNLKHFFKSDAYLKFVDNEILLQTIKHALKNAKDLEDLSSRLPEEYKQSFKFYRKDTKSFIYPSMYLQIESLLKAWPEVTKLKTKVSEFIDSEDNEDEDETTTSEKKIVHTFRNCYGQTTNIYSQSSTKEEKKLKSHIIGRVSNVKVSYQKEYSKFKKRILKVCEGHFEKQNSAVVLQTDIKSFFHNIDTEVVINYLKNNYNADTKILRTYLKEVQNNINSKELPIGWILSGPITDILLNIIHKKLKQYDEYEFISYVDDFVIIKKCSQENLENEYQTIEDKVFKILKKEFDHVFSKDMIQFHKEGDKTKKWKFSKDDLGVMDLTWFEMNDFSTVDLDLKWNAVNEFLLPSDNDLNLNERVQFLENLKNIKKRVQAGELRTWEQFEEYFKKIIFKVASSGIKYIPTILDILMTFHITNKHDVSECIKRIEDLYITTKKHNPSVNIWLSIFSSLKPYKDIPPITNWIFEKCETLISELYIQNKSQDSELLSTWAIVFKESTQTRKKFTIQNSPTTFFLKEIFKFQSNIEFIKFDVEEDVIPENEFELINTLRYIIFNNPSQSRKLSSVTIIKCIRSCSVETINEFLREGLYIFASTLNNDDINAIISELHKYPGYEQAINSLKELLESVKYAEKYIYQNSFSEKIRDLRTFYEMLYSHKPNVPRFIQSLSRDRLYYGQREIVTLQLHLSSDIDNWKKIFLGRFSSFDYNNYISSAFAPQIYPEIGFVLFFTIREISDIKISNILLAKNSRIKQKQIQKKIFKNLRISQNGKIILLKANVIHKMSRDGLDSMMDKLLVTLSPLDFDIDKDYVPENSYGHSPFTITELRRKIRQSLDHAIKSKSHFLVFPELCIPRQELKKLMEECGRNNIILIAGVEAKADSLKNYQNTTVISFPILKHKNPINLPYFAFFQHKNYPAPAEEFILKKNGYNYVNGKSIFLFESSKYGSFSVLTCSDFLSTTLRSGLKSKIQNLFVPAVNQDNSTYNATSESTMRELFCFCLICNNARKGSTTVMAPYNEPYMRNVFTLHGLSTPGFSTIELNVAEIKMLQELTPFDVASIKKDKTHKDHEVVSKFKQLPPDWEEFKK